MRICHLSDLHFGRHDARVVEGLTDDLTAQRPDLVVVSGDFTQVGSEQEFRAARTFLDTLNTPVFAVPGNHDVPARNLIRRFLDPYGLYRRYVASDLEPFVEMGGVVIAGIKTSRRMRAGLNWAHGAINRGQLDALERSDVVGQTDLVFGAAVHEFEDPFGQAAFGLGPEVGDVEAMLERGHVSARPLACRSARAWRARPPR